MIMQSKSLKNCRPSSDFYWSAKWLRVRDSALRRDRYYDMESKRYGITRQAEIVHHIFPREEFPEYQYELWNLISLSRKTHNEMHDRDTDELTEKGVDLLRRTCRKYGKEVPPKYLTKKKKGRKAKRDGYYY